MLFILPCCLGDFFLNVLCLLVWGKHSFYLGGCSGLGLLKGFLGFGTLGFGGSLGCDGHIPLIFSTKGLEAGC